MLKKMLIPCIALMACLLPMLATEAAPDAAGEVVAFVGEKISVELFPPTPEEIAAEKAEDERAGAGGMQRIRFQLNARLKAKYRVLQVVAGSHAGRTIEFITVDHYGRPRFAQQDPVLLYVKKTGSGYVHIRHPYAWVYPTREGGWAACSTGIELPSREASEELQAVHPVEFVPSVSFDTLQLKSALQQAGAAAREAHYDMAGERAMCRQGLLVNELVALHAKHIKTD